MRVQFYHTTLAEQIFTDYVQPALKYNYVTECGLITQHCLEIVAWIAPCPFSCLPYENYSAENRMDTTHLC